MEEDEKVEEEPALHYTAPALHLHQGCILFTRDSITAAYGFWEILILPMRLNSITAKLAGMALSRGH